MTPRNRRRRLEDIQQIADSLRLDTSDSSEGEAPDFTDAILNRVHQQRPFLTGRTRRAAVLCRVGAAIAAAVIVGGVVLVQATSPKIAHIAVSAQPVAFSPAVNSVRDTTAQALHSVRRGIKEISTLTDSARTVVTVNYVEHSWAFDQGQPGAPGCTLAASSPRPAPCQVRYVLSNYPASQLLASDEDDGPTMSYSCGGMIDARRLTVLTRYSKARTVYLMEPTRLRTSISIEDSLLGEIQPVITGQFPDGGFVPR